MHLETLQKICCENYQHRIQEFKSNLPTIQRASFPIRSEIYMTIFITPIYINPLPEATKIFR